MTQRSAEPWRTTEGVAMALGWGAKRPLTRATGLKKASTGAAVVHDAGGHDEEHLPVLKSKNKPSGGTQTYNQRRVK